MSTLLDRPSAKAEAARQEAEQLQTQQQQQRQTQLQPIHSQQQEQGDELQEIYSVYDELSEPLTPIPLSFRDMHEEERAPTIEAAPLKPGLPISTPIMQYSHDANIQQHQVHAYDESVAADRSLSRSLYNTSPSFATRRAQSRPMTASTPVYAHTSPYSFTHDSFRPSSSSSSRIRRGGRGGQPQLHESTTMPLPAEEVLEHIEMLQEELARREQEESQYSQSHSRISYNSYEFPYDTRDRTAAAPDDLSYYDYSISSSTAAAIAKSASTDEVLDFELKQQDVEFHAHQAEQLRRFQQLEIQQRRVHEEQREKARKEQALREAFDSRVADQVYRRSLAAAGGAAAGAGAGTPNNAGFTQSSSERLISRPSSRQDYVHRAATSNPVTPPSLHQTHSTDHSSPIALPSSYTTSSTISKSAQRSSRLNRDEEEATAAAAKRLAMSDSAPLYASADLTQKSTTLPPYSSQFPITTLPLSLLSSLPPAVQSHILALENRCTDLTQSMTAASDNQQRLENLLRIEESFREQLKESSKTRIQELKSLLEEAEKQRDELKAKDAVRMMQETVAETDQSEAIHAATSALESAADEREALQKELSTLTSSIKLEQAHSAAKQTHIQSLEERLLVEKGHVAQLETSNRSLQRQIQELLLKFQVQQVVLSSAPTSPTHAQAQPLSPISASMYAAMPTSPFSTSLQQVQLQQNASVDELNKVLQNQQARIEALQGDVKAQVQKLEDERVQSVSRASHFESTRQSLEQSLTLAQDELRRSREAREHDRVELARVKESLTKAERELRNAEIDLHNVREELEREKAFAKSLQSQQQSQQEQLPSSPSSAVSALEQKLQHQQHQDEITRLRDSHDTDIAQLHRDHAESISQLQQSHSKALTELSQSPPSSPAKVHSSLIQSMQSAQQKRDSEHLAELNELRRVHAEEVSRIRHETLQSSSPKFTQASLATVPESGDARTLEIESQIVALTAELDSLRHEKQSLASQLESLNRSYADVQKSVDVLSNEKKALEQNNRQLVEKHESNEKHIKLMQEEATASEHLIRSLQKEQQRATIQYSTSPPSRLKSLSPLANSGATSVAPLPPIHPNAAADASAAASSAASSSVGNAQSGNLAGENESPDMPVFTSVTAGGGTLGFSAGDMSESELVSTRQSPAGYNLMRLEADATPVSPYPMYDQSVNIEALHDSYNQEISLLQKKNSQLQQLNELSISLLKEEETKRKDAEKSITQLQAQIQFLERSAIATTPASSGFTGSDVSLANSTSTSSLSSLPAALSAQSTARSISTGSNAAAAPTSTNSTTNGGVNSEWPSTTGDSLQVLELQKDRERLNQETQTQSAEIQNLQKLLADKEKELTALRASCESISATSAVDIEHLQQHIESLTNEYNVLAQRWESLRSKYDKLKKSRKDEVKKQKEEEASRAHARTEAREAALATVVQHKGNAELLAVDVEYLMQEIITLQKENEKLQVSVVQAGTNGKHAPAESPNNDSMTDAFNTPQKTPLKASNPDATPLAPNNLTATPLAPASIANGAPAAAVNSTHINSFPLVDMSTPHPPSNQY